MKALEAFEKLNPGRYKASIALLVAANAVPLIGVFVGGWSTFEVVFLYWLENVVIGVVNILKMIICCPAPKDGGGEIGVGNASVSMPHRGCHHAIKLFLVPFFTVHYFMFCAGHGFFVVFLIGGGFVGMGFGEGLGREELIQIVTGWPMLLAVGGLLVSHLVSFAINFIGKGEYRKVTPDDLMVAPYGRIVILHVAIILGAWAITLIGSPAALLVLLIVLKTGMDIVMHLRSHQKAESLPDRATTVQ